MSLSSFSHIKRFPPPLPPELQDQQDQDQGQGQDQDQAAAAAAAKEGPFFMRKIVLYDIKVPVGLIPKGVRKYFLEEFCGLPVGGSVQRRVLEADGEIEQIIVLKLYGTKQDIYEVARKVVEHGAYEKRYWSFRAFPDESRNKIVTGFHILKDASHYVEKGDKSDSCWENKSLRSSAPSSIASDAKSKPTSNRLPPSFNHSVHSRSHSHLSHSHKSRSTISSRTGNGKQQVAEQENTKYLQAAAPLDPEEFKKEADEAKEEVEEAEGEVRDAKEEVKKAKEKVREADAQVEEAEKGVREAEAKVDEAGAKVDEAHERVREAQQPVEEARAQVRKLGQALCIVAEEDRAALEREKRLADQVLKDCEDYLAEKEAYVVKSKEFLAEKRELLAEREALVLKKKAYLAEKRELLAEREALVVKKKASLAEKRELLAEKEALLVEKKVSLPEKADRGDRGSSSTSSLPQVALSKKKCNEFLVVYFKSVLNRAFQ